MLRTREDIPRIDRGTLRRSVSIDPRLPLGLIGAEVSRKRLLAPRHGDRVADGREGRRRLHRPQRQAGSSASPQASRQPFAARRLHTEGPLGNRHINIRLGPRALYFVGFFSAIVSAPCPPMLCPMIDALPVSS